MARDNATDQHHCCTKWNPAVVEIVDGYRLTLRRRTLVTSHGRAAPAPVDRVVADLFHRAPSTKRRGTSAPRRRSTPGELAVSASARRRSSSGGARGIAAPIWMPGWPITSLGTWGTIRTRRIREGAYRSHTRIRDTDGVSREVTATGTTAAAADRALRQKLAVRATPTHQQIGADTTLAKLRSLWLAYLHDEDRIEASTIRGYERILTKVVLRELGGLRLREVTTSRLDLFLVRLRAISVSRQCKAKVVMGAMLGMAVRHDALAVNPVHQTSRINRQKAETRSLTPEDLRRVRAALREWTTEQRPGPQSIQRRGRHRRPDARHRWPHRRDPCASVGGHHP